MPTLTDETDCDLPDKNVLRLDARGRRAAFVAGLDMMAHRLAFRALPSPVARLLDGRSRIALYMAVDDEAPAHRLAEALVAAGKQLCLPQVMDRIGGMEFRAWVPGDPLVEGRYGIRAPATAAPACAPDAIIAPLVAFDGRLHRLGQGGGYYDRAFARFPDALRIGAAWSVQQIDRVPADPWDVPLDAVMTERSIILPHDEDAR